MIVQFAPQNHNFLVVMMDWGSESLLLLQAYESLDNGWHYERLSKHTHKTRAIHLYSITSRR